MFSNILKQIPLYAIGLMSGTSLDGVDVAIVEIKQKENIDEFHLYSFYSHPYPLDLKNSILKNSKPSTSDVQNICRLNVEIAYFYVESINLALEKANLTSEDIAFISSHGQTIWHNPSNMDKHASSTLQIGDANVLAYAFNKTVIYDFRPMDMAAGGNGAPLIPFIDELLFKGKFNEVVLTNIGGITNITYLSDDTIMAMDTGPGNMLIDGAMHKLFNQAIDEEGKIASSGKLIPSILNELMNDTYFSQVPPKSTGREKFNDEYLKLVIKKSKIIGANNEDIITTLTHFTVHSLIDQCQKFLPPFNLMIVAGGGSKNTYMMNLLKRLANFDVKMSDEVGLNSDAKEAIGFAILGYMRLKGIPSNLPKATGAREKVCLGSIILPPKKEKE